MNPAANILRSCERASDAAPLHSRIVLGFCPIRGAPCAAGLSLYRRLSHAVWGRVYHRHRAACLPDRTRCGSLCPTSATLSDGHSDCRYGGYYGVFGYQTFQIARKSGELRASNPGLILQFDPDTHSLVTKDANAFVSQHGIPVAYEPNPNFTPEGHLSYRLIRRDQCGIRKDSQARVQTYGMHFNNVLQQRVCVLRFPEAPAHAPVLATIRGDQEIWKRKWSISEYSTDLVL